MKRDNRNEGNPFRYFFTLLFFLVGVIMYIIIKQRGKNIREVKVVEGIKDKKVDSKREIVNNNEENILEKLTERQQLIIDEIKKKGSIYPTDLAELLPDVSTRTIRRDMTRLVELELVKQKGSTKSTYYTYIK
jgi:predicted HTH transcriptional regulator